MSSKSVVNVAYWRWRVGGVDVELKRVSDRVKAQEVLR